MSSPRKSISASSVVSSTRQRNMNPASTKSCESLYSNSSKGSANNIYRRKLPSAMDSKGGCNRPPAIIPATNEVRQRVLSARRLRIKTYQNQLANAQQTIAELAHENRILRTLHKRQDSALSKYESTNAELPQLLHSHAEELRMWQTKYRNLQAVNKDLEQKLKQKETIILSLSDQNKHYLQLSKDKHLDDRHRLTEKLQNLETRLQEKDNDIKMMARKMQLESKQAKQQLQLEQRKTKEVLMKLEKARLELSGFRKLEELQLQEKFNLNIRRQKNSNVDGHKDDRDLEKMVFHGLDAEALDDNEAPNSERSQQSMHSSHTVSQHSNRTVRKMHCNSFNETPQLQVNKASHSGILRRMEQGDGDAPKISTPTKFHATPLPLLEQPRRDTYSTEYEDDYENDEEDDTLEEGSNSEKGDHDHGDKQNIQCTDEAPNEEELYEENGDYFKEQQKIELPGKKIRMKEEISSIRKQISDDYKEREAFLDTFCRQATSGALKEDVSKKRNSIAVEHNAPNSSRKHKLLAALKAIDDNKSQD
ncbi:lebercilin-like protein [Stomoxys calcitrans]|uniref:lebercilin-like protein n=1 Tax=Stomoxys calcitrans TaxID=35570 RepID=UPI0027E31549|nr:lebercilin-like protein [Stomoxys calcitrans]XP_059226803.1 lebercilin-like protein [Stomoxys calcitrans]